MTPRPIGRSVLLAGALGLIVMMASCNRTNSKTTSASPALFPVVQNGQYGYINTSGTLIVTPQFDHAEDFVDWESSHCPEGHTW